MTDEQIKKNAFEYSLQNCCVYDDNGANDMDSIREAYIDGAHSRDEEIKELKERLKFADESIADADKWIAKYKLEIDKLSNPWISVKDRLPEKTIGLYKLEKDEQHKMVLFKTANGKLYIGYLDAEEIWRAFTVPYRGACPLDSFTWSNVTHWMPKPETTKGE